MKTCLAWLAASWMLAAGIASAKEDVPVDLQLVLAIDCSMSVDAKEFRIQMDGFARAFRHPAILQTIENGPIGAIAVTAFFWAYGNQKHIVVPWIRISDKASAEIFASAMEQSSRAFSGWTDVGSALEFAHKQFQGSGYESPRKVVDVSGDGISNTGPAPEPIREVLVEDGITINGLVIIAPPPSWPQHQAESLIEYYKDRVIGGPGAFLKVAKGFEEFGDAILSKLVSEIAFRPTATPYQEAHNGQ